MVQSQFALSWDSFKSNICNGFSQLQQNGEFVDMTLAADGHFVKVHQVLMAMVSPYIKGLITAAACPHPVIFLNNVSYRTLTCLLEYVYTGEVTVPSENLVSFVDTAKALHIKGLEDINSSGDATYKIADNINSDENIHTTGIKNLTLPSEEKSDSVIGLPAAARKVTLRYKKPKQEPPAQSHEMDSSQENVEYSDMMDTTDMHNDSDDGFEQTDSGKQKSVGTNNAPKGSNLQFTVSIRGSLQIILNRYIYNLHSSTHRKGVRRWRCVDYRNNRCMAFVVTKGNVVLNRANLHNHPFHDQKILQKIEKKAVFSALDDVENFKEKEQRADKQNTTTTEHEDYVAVEFPAEC